MANIITTFKDGDDGETVKQAILNSFNAVSLFIPNEVLCLTTEQRISMSLEYKTNKKIVYDTDLGLWYRFNSGDWEVYTFTKKYVKDFIMSEWTSILNDGFTLTISNTQHNVSSDAGVNISVKYLYNSVYENIVMDYTINTSGDITLKSDIAFIGKVVVS